MELWCKFVLGSFLSIRIIVYLFFVYLCICEFVYLCMCVCVFVYLRMCVCEFGQIGFSDGGWNCGAGPYWVSLSVYTVTLLNPVTPT